MKKRICFWGLMLLLFFVPAGCVGPDRTNYHLVNDKWEITYDGIVYSFEYVSNTKNSVSMKIERKNEFVIENIVDGSTRIEDKIFMFTGDGYFEYVKVDNKRVEEKTFSNFLVIHSYYEIGSNNVANIFVFTWNKHFKGYVEINISGHQIDDCWPTHIISLYLY